MNADLVNSLNQLRATLNQMELALGAIADAVIFVGEDSSVQWCNAAFEQLVNRPRSTLLGTQCSEVLPLVQDGERVALDAYPDFKTRKGEFEPTEYEFYQGDRAIALQITGRCANLLEETSVILVIQNLSARRSEFKYRDLFENSQVGIFRTRLEDGLILEANQHYIELAGYRSAAEVIGKKRSTEFYVNLEDRQRLLSELRQFGKVNNFEMQFRQASGAIRWGLYSIHLNPEENCLEGVFTDITDRKQVEAALKESEERWQLALQGNNDGIWDWNIRTDEAFFSRRWKAMLGYEDEELPNQIDTWTSRVHPEDLSRVTAILQAHINGETPYYDAQYRLQCKDSSYKWILSRGQALWDEAGNAVRMAGSHTDITERIRAEAALKESEARLNTILNSAIASIGHFRFYANGEWEIDYYSAGSSQIWGYPAEVLMANKHLLESRIVPEDLAAISQQSLENIYCDRTFKLEYRYLHPDGNLRWIAVTMSSVRDKAADCWNVTGIATDISDRKQAEVALAESEEKYRTLVETSQDMIFATSADGCYVFVNQAVKQIYGYEPEEMIGRPFVDFEPPEQIIKDRETFQRLLAGESFFQYESVQLAKDGRRLNLLFNAVVRRDAQGNVLGTTGTATNITERKQAELALRESEERYRRIIETTYEGIWTIDAGSKTNFVNARMAQMLGYSVEEMLGKHIFEFMDEEGVAIAALELERRRQGINENHDFKFRHKNGQEVWTIISTTSIFDRDGQYAGALAMITDISDRKRAEEELKASEARLNTILSSTLGVIQRARFYPNREWELEYCSAGSLHIWGYPAEQVIADKNIILAHVVPEDLETIYQHTFDAVFTESSLEFEYRYNHPTSGLRWYHFSISSVRDEAADCWLATSITTDVSDRKRAEEALRDSEARLNAILSNTSASIARYRIYSYRHWQIEYCSPGSLQIWGYVPEAVIADHSLVLSRIHPDDWTFINEQEAFAAISNGQSFEHEHRYHHPDGHLRWLAFNIASVRDEAANCWIATVIFTDITDRKRAEEALRQSEARFRALYEATSVAVSIEDETSIIDCNNAAAELFGYSRQSIVGMSAELFSPPFQPNGQDSASLGQHYVQIAIERGNYCFEWVHRRSDGTEFPTEVWLTAVQVGDRQLIQAVLHDLTERKQAEEALKASEARLNTILSSAFASIEYYRVFADGEWAYEYCSQGSAQIWGFSADELMANRRLVFSHIHPEDRENFYQQALQDTFAERSGKYEFRYWHPNGSTRWVALTTTSVRDEAANCWKVTAVYTDISDKKHTEIALAESEFKFRSIVENANDVLCIINLEGIVRYVSPNVVNLIGYTPAEMEGKSFETLVYPDEVPKLRNAFHQAATTGKKISELEYRAIHKEGRCIWEQANLSSFRDPNGETFIIGVVRDIGERKQAEEALRRSEQKYRSIYESSQVGIGRTRIEDGFFLDVNQRGAEIISGQHPNDLIGKRCAPEFHVNQSDRPQILEQLQAEGEVNNYEIQLRRANGSRGWGLLSLRLNREENCVEFVIADISDRKQAEEALKASEARLNTILTSAVASIIHYRVYANRDWEFEYYSPGSVLIWGVSAEELMADKYLISSRMHPEDWELIVPQMFESIFAERTHKSEYRYRHPDGSWRWISFNLTSVWDEAADCWFVTIIATDITDKKRVEIALQESELKFRTIVENANDVLSILSSQGTVCYVSPNVINLLGYTPTELEGESFAPLMHPDDLQKNWDAFNQLETTGEKISGIESRARHKDGRWRWLGANLSALRDVDGNLQILSVARDITERKQAEEALKASEARLSAIFNSAVASIQRAWVYADRSWRYEYFSPGSELIYGYTAEEILADRYLIASRIHPEDWEIVFSQIFENIFIESPEEYEYRHLHPDGNWRWIYLNITSVRNEAEDCWIVTVIATDITNRKNAEIALAESELKFRSIVENANDILALIDLEGTVSYVSPNVVNLIGFAPIEIEGQSFEPFVHPDDKPKFWEAFNRLATTDERLSGMEYRARNRGGNWRWLSTNLSTIRDASGNLLFISVSRDITERKQAEEALKVSEARLNAILNSAVASIQRNRLYSDRTWDFEYISPGCELIYGYTAEEIFADRYLLSSRVHPEDWDSVILPMFDRIYIESPGEYEYRYLHPDGNWRWICINITSTRDDGLDCWIVNIIANDITARKQAEAALAERARLAAFRADVGSALGMNDSLAAILKGCVAAAIAHLNATFARIWTFNPKDQIFELKASAGLYTRLNGTYSRVPSTKFFIDSQPQPYITNNLVDDPYVADRDWVRREGLQALACYPIVLEQELLGIIAIFARQTLSESTLEALQFAAREIALGIKRKQAEAALEHRAVVESLLSSISRHFIDQDVDTAINFTLEAIANFIGCDRSYIFEYFDDQKQYALNHEWHTAGIQPISDSAKGGSLLVFPWFYNRILSNQVVDIPSVAELPPEAAAEQKIFQSQSMQSLLAVPMTHSGKVVGCLGISTVYSAKTWTQDDINFLKLVGELIAIGCARHQAEEALLVAKEAAEAANRAKSTFLANMSHELRTPLNAILGFAQLMERDTTLSSGHRDSLGIINRSGEHLLNLINDVLEMSKIEAGYLALNPTAFDLHHLLQTLQPMFEVKAQAKQLGLHFEIASDLPQYVLTDEGKLRQVLINLLSNAVKFTQQGDVRLRASFISSLLDRGQEISRSHEQVTLCFEVEDTGSGIAPEEIDHLFHPFVQTMSGMQAREGTGLGLTISRQFVQLMGGDIHLVSTVGQGSVFSFEVQATLTEPTQAIAQPLTRGRVLKLAANQPKYRVLVVDDRQENRELLVQLLQAVGFETQSATNGQEAIASWQQWHPHLIWMDMRMPVMNGYEATKQIKARERQQTENNEFVPKTAIIALTASAFEEQQAHILAAGCDDFVRKPFQEQTIFEKMALHLGVHYLYAEDAETGTVGDVAIALRAVRNARSAKLTAADLAVMPAEWKNQLYQAAIEVDAEKILQLIEQVGSSHQALAEGLTNLVRHFDFDEILDLLLEDNHAESDR